MARPVGQLDRDRWWLRQIMDRIRALESTRTAQIGDWSLFQNEAGELVAKNKTTGQRKVIAP